MKKFYGKIYESLHNLFSDVVYRKIQQHSPSTRREEALEMSRLPSYLLQHIWGEPTSET